VDEGGFLSQSDAGSEAEVIELPLPGIARTRADAEAASRHEPNDDEFAAIVAANDDRLRALAYHLLDSREAMDDVLQEVYLKAYRGLPAFRGDSALATRLYRITYTTCMDRLRREPPSVPLSPEVIERVLPAGEAFDERVARIDQLHRALSALDGAPVSCRVPGGHGHDASRRGPAHAGPRLPVRGGPVAGRGAR